MPKRVYLAGNELLNFFNCGRQVAELAERSAYLFSELRYLPINPDKRDIEDNMIDLQDYRIELFLGRRD